MAHGRTLLLRAGQTGNAIEPAALTQFLGASQWQHNISPSVGGARDYLIEDGMWERHYDAKQMPLLHRPATTLDHISRATADHERFLMDTCQLLMSSLGIRASESSILDAKRGILLTQLATIYVPLSFVTGI